jgi:UDP-glucose 4-epimerase
MFTALKNGNRGEIWVPKAPSSNIMTIAKAMIGKKNIKISIIGVRPGEKIHETMITEEEIRRTTQFLDKYYIISPMLPEICDYSSIVPIRTTEYTSCENLLSLKEIQQILSKIEL